jgi:uncharacterized membrane protein (UPF0127 family)
MRSGVEVADAATGDALLSSVEVAETVWEKTVGLLGRNCLEPEGGMLLRGCSSIHMWFMRFPLDLVYLDHRCEVLRVVEGLKPWRVSFCFGASAVLELAAGSAKTKEIVPGRRLCFRERQA